MQKQIQVCEHCGASLGVPKTLASRTVPGRVTPGSALEPIICPSCEKETGIFKKRFVSPQVD